MKTTAENLVAQWLGSATERVLSVKQAVWLSDLIVGEGIGTPVDTLLRRQYFHIEARHYFLCFRQNGSAILRPHSQEAK